MTSLRIWRLENDKVKVVADELRLFAKALRTTVTELVA